MDKLLWWSITVFFGSLAVFYIDLAFNPDFGVLRGITIFFMVLSFILIILSIIHSHQEE